MVTLISEPRRFRLGPDGGLIPFARHLHDFHDREHDEHFDEDADVGRERGSGIDAERADGRGYRQFEEVAGVKQRDAFDGVRRFSEFQAGLGIAKGMLAARLRDLTKRGILETAPASDGTAYNKYVLTEKGRSLFLVIVALRQWDEDYLYRPDEPRSSLVDTEISVPGARLELRA